MSLCFAFTSSSKWRVLAWVCAFLGVVESIHGGNGILDFDSTASSRKIAILKGAGPSRQILVLNTNGGTRMASRQGEYTAIGISPDDERVVYLAIDASRRWLLGPAVPLYRVGIWTAGSHDVEIIRSRDVVSVPHWSPSGHHVGFALRRFPTGAPPSETICVSNATGDALTRELLSGMRLASLESWAWLGTPDRLVVWVLPPGSRGSADVWLLDATTGSGRRWLTGAAIPGVIRGAPSGDRVFWTEHSHNGKAYLMTTAGQEALEIRSPSTGLEVADAAWDDDGGLIAVYWRSRTGSEGQIQVLTEAGALERTLPGRPSDLSFLRWWAEEELVVATDQGRIERIHISDGTRRSLVDVSVPPKHP